VVAWFVKKRRCAAIKAHTRHDNGALVDCPAKGSGGRIKRSVKPTEVRPTPQAREAEHRRPARSDTRRQCCDPQYSPTRAALAETQPILDLRRPALAPRSAPRHAASPRPQAKKDPVARAMKRPTRATFICAPLSIWHRRILSLMDGWNAYFLALRSRADSVAHIPKFFRPFEEPLFSALPLLVRSRSIEKAVQLRGSQIESRRSSFLGSRFGRLRYCERLLEKTANGFRTGQLSILTRNPSIQSRKLGRL
jgi:hypothetical protein